MAAPGFQLDAVAGEGLESGELVVNSDPGSGLIHSLIYHLLNTPIRVILSSSRLYTVILIQLCHK